MSLAIWNYAMLYLFTIHMSCFYPKAKIGSMDKIEYSKPYWIKGLHQ